MASETVRTIGISDRAHLERGETHEGIEPFGLHVDRGLNPVPIDWNDALFKGFASICEAQERTGPNRYANSGGNNS